MEFLLTPFSTPRNSPKKYDPNIYPGGQAEKLYEYSEFIQSQPRAKTPTHLASNNKNARNIDLIERTSNAPPKVAASSHSSQLVLSKKDDFDREFRLLGRGADFSEVQYHVPDEQKMLIGRHVNGPATGRLMKREKAERDRLELAIMANETDAEKKKRKLKESADKKAARRDKKNAKEDWRETADPDTRVDTDFMTELFDDTAVKRTWKTATQIEQEKLKASPPRLPEHIGPKTKKIDYQEIDKVAWQEICKNRIPVREQLKNRMVEEKAWDSEIEAKPISENKCERAKQRKELRRR